MQDSLPCPLRKKNVIFLRWTFYSVLLKCFISLNSSDCHPDRSDHPTIIHPDRTDHPTNVIHPALSPQVGLMKHDLENTARKHFNYKKRCKWLNGHNTTWPLQCRSSFFSNFSFQKQRLNLREISVRILRSDTWKTTVPTLQFLGYAQARKPCSKGNAILKYQCFQSHILEQPASNFCEDGKHT